MSKEVQKLCEKCHFFLGSTIKNNKKTSQCTHAQKRRSRRILERKMPIVNNRNLTILRSKQSVDENPSQNSSTDENCNLLTTNSQVSISDLPNEMLCHIFSQLPFMDRYYNAGNVCRRWNLNARNPFLWRTIQVDSKMNSVILLKLLSQATALRSLEVTNRRDANAILRKVIKFCPKIEYITMSNCRGSKSGLYVSFGSLMKAVTTHKNLKIMLKEGTGLSAPPSPNSKIMKEYSVKYRVEEGNVITIIPISRL